MYFFIYCDKLLYWMRKRGIKKLIVWHVSRKVCIVLSRCIKINQTKICFKIKIHTHKIYDNEKLSLSFSYYVDVTLTAMVRFVLYSCMCIFVHILWWYRSIAGRKYVWIKLCIDWGFDNENWTCANTNQKKNMCAREMERKEIKFL